MSGTTTTSYWCYGCSRFVIPNTQQEDSITCPECHSGCVEQIENNDSPARDGYVNAGRVGFPAAAMYMNRPGSEVTNFGSGPDSGTRGSRRTAGDWSPFNPVVVLRRPPESDERGYGLYYDDGNGMGLRPLPPSMSEVLLGSGFDRILDQLNPIVVNGFGRYQQPPASKAAIESIPTIGIVGSHVDSELHCAVCMDQFELGSEAREMPCKHIYHSDCIIPWLSMRNSCPVCRHELPMDSQGVQESGGGSLSEDGAVGLTIWRLPGEGFAVGRFLGGRRGEEREFPAVYTELDGGFNNGGVPRRVSWAANGRRGREQSGLRRMFSNLRCCFGRIGSSSSSRSETWTPSRNMSLSLFRPLRRRRWAFEVSNRARR